MPGAQPSPYGGMPAQAPPTNRTPLFIALGVLGGVAILGLLYLLTSGDDDNGGETTSTSQPNDTTVATSEVTEPPTTEDDGGGGGGGGGSVDPGAAGECDIPETDLGDGLVITDCGFSSPEYAYEEGSFLPSWGFVVENQGDSRVEAANFGVTLEAENGSTIDFQEITVHVIPGGESMGVGSTMYNFDAVSEPVATVKVSYTGLGEVYTSPGDGSLTVSNETTSVVGDSTVETSFSVESSYSDRVEDPVTYLIYRNSAGDIIGGYNDGLQPDIITSDSPTTVYIENTAVFEDIDPEATEAYVDHGYTYS